MTDFMIGTNNRALEEAPDALYGVKDRRKTR